MKKENLLLWKHRYRLYLIKRKKDSLYPLKLRVYYQVKMVRYPLINDLTKLDFEKLDAKRVNDFLSKIRESIETVELQAKITAKMIIPFDFEHFANIFILESEYFRKRLKPNKTEANKQDIFDDIPAE